MNSGAFDADFVAIVGLIVGNIEGAIVGVLVGFIVCAFVGYLVSRERAVVGDTYGN